MWTSCVGDVVGVVHGGEELAGPWVTKVVGSTGTGMDCGNHTELITTNPLRGAPITVEEREKPRAVGELGRIQISHHADNSTQLENPETVLYCTCTGHARVCCSPRNVTCTSM